MANLKDTIVLGDLTTTGKVHASTVETETIKNNDTDGVRFESSIYPETTQTIQLGDISHCFSSGYIHTIHATRVEPNVPTSTLFIGPSLNVGDKGIIKLFSGDTTLFERDNYSSLRGAVLNVAASTWTSVAPLDTNTTILVIGASYNYTGGFVAMASGDTLYTSYKSGCVKDIRVSDDNLQIYTNGNAPAMRILYLKAFD